jgi:hypothetical protein
MPLPHRFCFECGRRVTEHATANGTFVCTGCDLPNWECVCSPVDYDDGRDDAALERYIAMYKEGQ